MSTESIDQNALQNAHDFIRPGEEDEYLNTRARFFNDLNPTGELELTLANEIVSAAWRLRRCRLTEAAMALRAGDDFTLSPEDENRQKSVDRARAQADTRLNRAISTLRKIQTERTSRNELGITGNWGLAECSQVLKAVRTQVTTDRLMEPPQAKQNLAAIDAMLRRRFPNGLPPEPTDAMPPSPEFDPGSFCKTAPTPHAASANFPGNARCPCRSGMKYEECCGNPAATEPAQDESQAA